MIPAEILRRKTVDIGSLAVPSRGISRLVLALKTLCRFTTAEIALVFQRANVLKRFGRAREHLRELPPDSDSLPLQALQSRLASVHAPQFNLCG